MSRMALRTSVVDCHVHLGDLDSITNLSGICDHVGFDRMNVVCTISSRTVNANPAAFVAKSCFPKRFYVFAGLDHSAYFSSGRVGPPPLAEQVDRLVALGVDGIKMIEAKPTSRKSLDIPVTSEYFEDYFAHVEELGLPLLWHVADPEEFWDPGKTPGWAKQCGWGYDDTFVSKEHLYAEVENVLTRYPKLKVIFAHFYFLSADLPRASGLLDHFGGVHLDLAPGVELLYNLSRDTSATRSFFEDYADRILFGTDISSGQRPEEAALRAGIVTRWLETDEEYHVPPGADFLLGPPEDGIMRGLALPSDVLQRIYRGNFERIAGEEPKTLNRDLAAQECERLAEEAKVLSGEEPGSTQAAEAAARLRE